jgi:putative flippase GtrA
MARGGSPIWRFIRNCLTGGLATGVYFAVYLPLHRGTGLPQSVADNVGLVVGAAVQFLGARYFVFRARQGKVHKQLAGFLLAELATLLMNVLLLWVARKLLPSEIGQSDLLVLATSFIVFAGFSYPIWHLVFHAPNEEAAPVGAASDDLNQITSGS